MNAAEIVAYVGAAAWLPQIATWVYKRFVTPKLTIVPGEAQIGFSRFGAIFNVRIAFSVERKDLIIDGFAVTLKHEDGEVHALRWYGLSEEFSEMTDEAGNRTIIKRDQAPIALKIGTESLVEKFVRFQEPKFHDAGKPLLSKLVAHYNFLKESGDPDFAKALLASKELHDVVRINQGWFWWRTGKYDVTFQISSPKRFSFPESKFSFELPQLDVDHLRHNIKNIEIDLHNLIKSSLPSYKPDNVVWNWANVPLRRAG